MSKNIARRVLDCPYAELLRYIFFGFITTGINLLLFWLFILFGLHYIFSNVISFILAVILSYYLNCYFVFNRKYSDKDSVVVSCKFYVVRLLSIIFDSILLYVCCDMLSMDVILSKIVVSSIVIVSTFILNKYFVFHAT